MSDVAEKLDTVCAAIANAVSRCLPPDLKCKIHINATNQHIEATDVTLEVRSRAKK